MNTISLKENKSKDGVSEKTTSHGTIISCQWLFYPPSEAKIRTDKSALVSWIRKTKLSVSATIVSQSVVMTMSIMGKRE